MPALKPSAEAVVALIGRALSLCCQLYSLAAEIMGILMYVVIFHFPLGMSHFGVAVVPSRVAYSVYWGMSCFGGTPNGWDVLGGIPLRGSWEQDTQFLAR